MTKAKSALTTAAANLLAWVERTKAVHAPPRRMCKVCGRFDYECVQYGYKIEIGGTNHV